MVMIDLIELIDCISWILDNGISFTVETIFSYFTNKIEHILAYRVTMSKFSNIMQPIVIPKGKLFNLTEPRSF